MTESPGGRPNLSPAPLAPCIFYPQILASLVAYEFIFVLVKQKAHETKSTK